MTHVLASRNLSVVVACKLTYLLDLYRRNFSTLLGPFLKEDLIHSLLIDVLLITLQLRADECVGSYL